MISKQTVPVFATKSALPHKGVRNNFAMSRCGMPRSEKTARSHGCSSGYSLALHVFECKTARNPGPLRAKEIVAWCQLGKFLKNYF